MIYGGYYANIYYAHISLIVSEMKQVPSAKCHYKQAIESLTHSFIQKHKLYVAEFLIMLWLPF